MDDGGLQYWQQLGQQEMMGDESFIQGLNEFHDKLNKENDYENQRNNQQDSKRTTSSADQYNLRGKISE